MTNTQETGIERPGLARDWTSPGCFALLLAIMIFIPFWDVLLGLRTFALRDYLLYSYPAASFQRECFWRGELPLWNPYNCCGIPFLAQLNTLSLYPLSLIYLLLPLTWGLPAFCILHLFLAGMGGYYLAVQWTNSRPAGMVAGVIFAFNGLILNFLMWPSHVATFAWLPWVVVTTERAWKSGGRNLAFAGLTGALQILGGGPETILFTWLILTALAILEACRTPSETLTIVRRFLAAGSLALVLAAAQLLPFAQLVQHGNRTSSSYNGSAWSMPLGGPGNFLVPLFQTARWQQIYLQVGQAWTSSYYAGIGAVFLAVVALRRRRHPRVLVLGLFLVASVVLALGDRGVVFLWLKRLVPFLGMFRYPVKFVILSVAVLPLLAAEGVVCYENLPPSRRFAIELAGGIFFLMGVLVFINWRWPAQDSSWTVAGMNALSRAALLMALMASLWLFATRVEWRGWSALLVAGVFWADLLTHQPWQNPTAAPLVFQPKLGIETAGLSKVPTLATSRLILSPYATDQICYSTAQDMTTNSLVLRVTFFDNCNLLDDVPKVDGFFTLNLRETDRVLRLFDHVRGSQMDALEDFLSVSETTAPGKVFDWVARTNFIPVISIGKAPVFATETQAFQAVATNGDLFHRVVYLPESARGNVSAQAVSQARIIATDFAELRQTVRVASPKPAILVVNQAYYPNWKATIDGRPATLWPANYLFEAVEVPAGEHDVVFAYRDRMFCLGLAISALGVVVCAILLTKPPKSAHFSVASSSYNH